MQAKIRLIVKTPIHIGSGEDYWPYDYLITNNSVKIINDIEFNKRVLSDEKLYQNFLEISENSQKIVSFYRKNAKEFLEEIKLKPNAKEYLSKRGDIRAPINQFIKDVYKKVYIPGSSIKGAIRTAVANYIFNQKYEDLKDIQNENKFMAQIFCNQDKFDATKDFLKVLSISDLKPVNVEKNIIQPFNKGKEDFQLIPVILEVVKNGEFEGTININENLLKKISHVPENFDFEFIKTCLKDYYQKINSFERKREWWQGIKIPEYEEYLIKIGKHSGAGAKTIENKRKIKVDVKDKKGKKVKKDFAYQLSTWCDEDKNQLGWTKLEIKP
ncbi:type III-A CRISPR-associated RAMP protein Csm5 [Nitratiruptor tergarcus]|uniref:CRISPR system Cms protein Csm5 n=1 Tax=Nitratiruptor tergarcus DSM 16512 TaxID=1069081 RepID=A0A1W1WSC3_9BACT|nr:type III-A CRISPR-associated RAMP protein Csm5 [Nitratiruptor tergarcus]SMC09197.1 CRISPR type III-A/MTUBE-associated RAMP protein Csm5 [Nitratiruptor tergarcus DSM 16512]